MSCPYVTALSIVWNLTLAPKFHGEKLTQQNITATAVICIGVTATVIFSSHKCVLRESPCVLVVVSMRMRLNTCAYGVWASHKGGAG